MTTVESGQIWRHAATDWAHETHVIVSHLGPYQSGSDEQVLWVAPCDADGEPTGNGYIPMAPPTDDGGGFPGEAWELVGQVSA
jgi:hypothetical protein